MDTIKSWTGASLVSTDRLFVDVVAVGSTVLVVLVVVEFSFLLMFVTLTVVVYKDPCWSCYLFCYCCYAAFVVLLLLLLLSLFLLLLSLLFLVLWLYLFKKEPVCLASHSVPSRGHWYHVVLCIKWNAGCECLRNWKTGGMSKTWSRLTDKYKYTHSNKVWRTKKAKRSIVKPSIRGRRISPYLWHSWHVFVTLAKSRVTPSTGLESVVLVTISCRGVPTLSHQ